MSASLLVAFFLSGAAGLIFQVVWFHKAGLALGNSLSAVTAVLSSFMAGLAVGNFLAGRLAHRVHRARSAYATLESVVALTGLAATVILPLLTPLAGASIAIFEPGAPGVRALRFILVFLVFALPATAMGATLPILMGASAPGRERFGRALGRHNGVNTLGAVAGLLFSETVLIARLGINRTAWVAAALQLRTGHQGASESPRWRPRGI